MKPYIAVFICLMTLTLGAQQPATPKAPSGPAAPTAPAPPRPPSPREAPDWAGAHGERVNVRLDVTITEQSSAGKSQPKTITMMLADRAFANSRSPFGDRRIDIDANPFIEDGRIRVILTMRSERLNPGIDPKTPFGDDPEGINWNHKVTLLLETGKPMIALETSDPAKSRKTSIEVKATIQR